MLEPSEEPRPEPRRDAIVDAIARAAHGFLESPTWEEAMPDALAQLGEAAEASRTYVFENVQLPDGSLGFAQRVEWVAPGISSQADNPRMLSNPWADPAFSRWSEPLARGEPFVSLIDDLPGVEQEEPRRQDIRSIALVPIFVGEEWWGLIGFDDCVSERVWSAAEIDALRAAAAIIGAAIHRERYEARVREAEERYRALVERTPAITYVEVADDPSDWGSSMIYVSPRIEAVLGYAPERFAEPGFWTTLVHPDDRDRVAEEVVRATDVGDPFSIEYRMIAADGRAVWFHDQAVRLPDTDGREAWQGVMVDITERRGTEAKLREAEERYRALVERLPAVVYVESLPRAPGTLYMSPRVEDMFGYTADEWRWTQGFWIERIHPDERERIRARNDHVNATGEMFAEEYRFLAGDGSYRWVYDEAMLVRDGAGEPLYWQGFLQDITDRKEAELQLREAEQRFRTLVEQNPAVIYTQMIDPDDPSVSRTIYISPGAEELTGYSAEASTANPQLWLEMVHPDDRLAVEEADAHTNATGRPFDMEYRLVRADGGLVWVRDRATIVQDEEGHPRFWQGFMLDVTDRKEAEERLAQALEVEREAGRQLRIVDEMKNTFLQAVSHDLRTPLAAILGLAVTLERADIDLSAEDVRDLATRIAGNARKLERLVTDLLDLDRLARGIVEPKLHPTDLGALARRVASESDLAADGRIQVEADEVVLPVDAPKVERIIENLLANTIRHTPSETNVWLRVQEAAGGGAILSVEDDGPGIPPELRHSIFEPFRQGPDAPTHAPGVGVGLTLVARFAELHGGRAWAEERKGGGAAFRVYLPEHGTPRPAAPSSDGP